MKYTVLIFLLALTFSVNAQVSTEPVQPPWYFYWPTEDADNFENSRLSNSSLGSGDRLQRRSNVEVNKQPEETATTGNTSNQPSAIDTDIPEPSVNVNSRPVSSSRLIKWTDDDGVVHVTNNPDSVPEKYKDQIKN